jgi:hydroxyacylglutathione hydrolase
VSIQHVTGENPATSYPAGDRSISGDHKQWVCTTCGYNMMGEMPDVCPFCGATHDKFVTWDEA